MVSYETRIQHKWVSSLHTIHDVAMRQEYNTNGFPVYTPFMMYGELVGASLFCPCNERVQFQTLVSTDRVFIQP
jgi:hypothetical protein